MAIECYPLESSDILTELQWSRMSRMYSADGVEGTPGTTGLKVTAGAGRSVNIAAGQGLVRGIFVRSTAVENVGIGSNATGNPRIDKVVFRVNTSTHTGTFVVIPGTPAPAPTAPVITYTDTTFDLALADVRIESNGDTVSTVADRRQYIAPYGLIPATSTGRPNTRGLPGIAFESDTGRVVFTSGDGVWDVGLGTDLYSPTIGTSRIVGEVSSFGYVRTLTGAGNPPVMEADFASGPSGRVRIHFGAYIIKNGPDCHISCKIAGSGGTVIVDDNDFTISCIGEGRIGGSFSALNIFEMPPNGSFHAELHYRVDGAGEAQVDNRFLEIQRLP